MLDLAPMIYRQRAIVEGRREVPLSERDIENYLNSLAEVLDMRPLMTAVTHRSEQFGWAGWIHWETSGAHFYAWDSPYPFFSVDVYTCKAFSLQELVSFTTKFFETTTIEFKDV
jgi:hypothetical protein